MKKNMPAIGGCAWGAKKIYLIIGVIYFFCINTVFGATSWPADNSGTDIGTGLPAGYEPSGIVWHERLEKLLLVWDNGYVTQMDSDGNIDFTVFVGGDLEGITVADPSSDYIYLGVESPDAIREFSLTSQALTGKEWDLTTWMTGPVNSGLEALAFIPNGYHKYAESTSGGIFITGLQDDGTFFVFDVDLSTSGSVSNLDSFNPIASADIADLFFNKETELLYGIYDGANELVEVNMNNELVNEYTGIPATNQEGFCFYPSYPASTATVFIAQDSGGVIKLNNYPVTYPDSDGDGIANIADTYPNDYDNDGSETGVDCNDNDATIQDLVTYYQDLDGDSLGSDIATAICQLTPPTGYVANSNDQNDNDYDNDGSETGTDCDDSDANISINQTYYADEDGDALGDPNNSIAICSYIPPTGYVTNSNDLDDSINNIVSVEGTVNGQIIVTQENDVVNYYTVFSGLTSDKLTKIIQYPETGYYLVLHPYGKQLALVNAYTGTVLSAKNISKKSYSINALKLFTVRNQIIAVVISKIKSQNRLTVFKVNIAQTKLIKKDSETIKHKNLSPSKTIEKKNKILLKNKKSKTIFRYLVTKKFNLKQY